MTEETKRDLQRVFDIIDIFESEGIAKHFMTDIQPIETLEERASENTEHIRNFKSQIMTLKYKIEQWAKAYESMNSKEDTK